MHAYSPSFDNTCIMLTDAALGNVPAPSLKIKHVVYQGPFGYRQKNYKKYQQHQTTAKIQERID